ncbi:hypothetical protein RIF29_22127 [Crotalaria pallida]|uniref:Uncharacterized protein n=1 Tax=Crotalaria pallida TaxID=3830 RepID=A0AAN9F893_CROPI
MRTPFQRSSKPKIKRTVWRCEQKTAKKFITSAICKKGRTLILRFCFDSSAPLPLSPFFADYKGKWELKNLMARGGKVSRKHNLRKKGRRSKEDGGSDDDSDEDYVVSDDVREASDDNSEYYCSSLDGCASEDSLDSFIVKKEEDEDEDEEEEEFRVVRNSNRSKARNSGKTSRKRGRITPDKEEEEEEEIRGVWNFNRSKAKNGVKKNANRTSRKRGLIAYALQLEEEEEEEKIERDGEEEEEVKAEEVERDGEEEEEEEVKAEKVGEEEEDGDSEYKQEDEEDVDEDEYKVEEEEEEEDVDEDEYKVEEEEEEGVGDDEVEEEDFDCDDDEFTPEEEDYSDEEEEVRGRKKKNNGMKMGKKVSLKRAPVVSTRGRRRRSSGASKKPFKNRRRKNGGFRKRVRCDSEDDFINNGSPIRTTSRKQGHRKRRRLVLADSGSDHESSASDVEYTISEEEREQLREAKELCGGSRTNLRSSSLLTKNEEVGVHDDLHQQRKPPVRKGKEKIEEPQVRKGKEKVEGSKSEVVKQVCGICLSEEDRRRTRGVLNCCTHYFCFTCINEWAKVESRCPLCKQRFQTISKPARPTAGLDLREVVIQVPERDQVYQPSEEELRSYIDPYESVICSECHQGGDDGLMLLCDICDSPAHTYCVGLGREVPEGNWYCDGCRPVALESLSSQVQEHGADPRVQPVRPPPLVLNVRESIDLNSVSSPHTAFNLGFGQFSSPRFTGRSVQGVSPVSGGGAPTLSGRRWIHRQIHQLLSMDRMLSTTGRLDIIPATSSTSNLFSSQIVQSIESTAQHLRTQDVGTSHHTFFDERSCNNSTSPLVQNGAFTFFDQGLCNNNTSPLMQNGALWPGLTGTPPIPDCERVYQFSRSDTITDGSSLPSVREEGNFNIAMEQLHSMVKSHLMSLQQNIDLDAGHNTLKDIARISMNNILAACGLEHNKSEVCNVLPPPVCQHIELMGGGQTSLIKGCCTSCFDSFVGVVVKRILEAQNQWLRLRL